MKHTLIVLIVLALAGCASLDNAGHTGYTVKPFAGPTGELVCCELSFKDGKEYSGRNIGFQANGAGYGLTISEGESKAFKGQSIGATLNPLPTIGLDKILAP